MRQKVSYFNVLRQNNVMLLACSYDLPTRPLIYSQPQCFTCLLLWVEIDQPFAIFQKDLKQNLFKCNNWFVILAKYSDVGLVVGEDIYLYSRQNSIPTLTILPIKGYGSIQLIIQQLHERKTSVIL